MGLKLYVDDVRQVPTGWHLARTITQAIRILATFRVEVISLDHDIGYLNEDGTISEETFEAVVWYLKLMPENIRPRIEIHSDNPYARNKYKGILNENS